MGANLLIAVTILVQSSPPDTPTQANPTLASDTIDAEPGSGLAFEQLSDLLQYNRVQGLSLGIGYRLRVPGVRSGAMYSTVRYGFSDERITGRVSLVRDVPEFSISVSGYHDIADLDPFSRGRSISNSLNGLFAAHDNGDYAVADGAAVTLGVPLGTTWSLSISARAEHQHSAARMARSAINDFFGGSGLFPANPAIRDGVFGGLMARISGVRRYRWNMVLDLLGGQGQTTARVYGGVRRSLGRNRLITVNIKAGAGTEPSLPQTLFRLGGLNSVRGFEYGTLRTPAFWATQLDFSPFAGRVRPVLFIDAGQGARLGDLFSTPALVGGGAGIALFRGLVRLDFSRPISPSPGRKVRFDLVLQALR